MKPGGDRWRPTLSRAILILFLGLCVLLGSTRAQARDIALEETSMTIGAEGGALSTSFGDRLQIAPGTLYKQATIQLSAVSSDAVTTPPPDGYRLLSRALTVQPDDLELIHSFPPFHEVYVAHGISNPTAMAFAPDGRLFVLQQQGDVAVIKDGILLAEPFLSLELGISGETGLLGIAFDPAFQSNHYVYLYYTARSPVPHNRVSRFTADGDRARPGSEHVVLDMEALEMGQHDGGAIHFGTDGKLYVAVGDDGHPENAQDVTNRKGKLLRINADGSIPPGNPAWFVTAAGVRSTSGANRAIYAIGFRNPFTFDINPATGAIFVNDVGTETDQRYEEINALVRGGNYGWPVCEGPCHDPRFIDPIHAYADESCAITGSAFYAPSAPALPRFFAGKYFFTDFCAGWIKWIDPADPGRSHLFDSQLSEPVDLKVGPDGALYYLQRGDGGLLQKIVFDAAPPPPAATLTLAYTDDELAGADPAQLVVAELSDNEWRFIGSAIDLDARTLAASIDRLATFAILQPIDADGDGMPDLYEQAHPCLRTLADDAVSDDDHDALDNATEFTLGSDPCNADTDGSAPVPRITSPADLSDFYIEQQPVPVEGIAYDPRDGGYMPGSSLSWSLTPIDPIAQALGRTDGQRNLLVQFPEFSPGFVKELWLGKTTNCAAFACFDRFAVSIATFSGLEPGREYRVLLCPPDGCQRGIIAEYRAPSDASGRLFATFPPRDSSTAFEVWLLKSSGCAGLACFAPSSIDELWLAGASQPNSERRVAVCPQDGCHARRTTSLGRGSSTAIAGLGSGTHLVTLTARLPGGPGATTSISIRIK